MANFDLDDPLGDLLSDGSNDGFFEESKPKRGSMRKSLEKKTVEQLFRLDLDKPAPAKKETNVNDDWLGTSEKPSESLATPQSNLRPQTARTTKKIQFEDNIDDLFGGLGLDNKKAASEGPSKPAKKSDFMDDLLSSNRSKLEESKTGDLFDDLLPTPKTEGILKTTSNTFIETTRPSSEGQKVFGSSEEIMPSTKPFHSLDSGGRESRRSRTPMSSSLDPLGLLAAASNESLADSASLRPKTSPIRKVVNASSQESVQTLPDRPSTARGPVKVEVVVPVKDGKTKSAPNITELPDWLGGAKVKSNASETSLDKIDDSNHQQAIVQPPQPSTPLYQPPQPQIIPQADNTYLTQQKLTSSSIEYQNTAIALQQQESQVLMALQLRKYENSMSEMQRQQQELLIKQEQSFNTLLDRQFAKQQLIENNIRLQQERINNHIQLLVANPSAKVEVTENGNKDEFAEVKSVNREDLKGLYEGMIVALKERHKEEMFLMEESYKKQLTTLEQSMEAIESRLKQEIDTLTVQNSTKIETIKDEHSSDLALHKAKLQEIKSSHNLELAMLRENQNRVIEEIKYEHNTILENLKQSRNASSLIVDDAGTYASKLDVSLKMLEVNSRNLAVMQEDVEKKYGVLTMAREESLKAKEEEIKLMRLALDKAREEANTERSQLMTLVRTLELKLAQQSQDGREERYALQQATAMLTARSAALDRDAEFNRNCLEREREQLKTLRETILGDQEQSILSLNEEKLSLSAERAKLEISRKLHTNSFSEQRSRAEVEAAVQVAKEAAELADIEREQLQRRYAEVETFKRTLGDKERKLLARERELDVLQRSAEVRGKEGEEALMEAQLLRSNHNLRLKELQKQLKSLSLREKRIAEDKISLSKERLSLHSLSKKSKRCSLCKVEDTESPDRNNLGYLGNYQALEEENADDEESVVEHDIPRFISVNDADMFRLQLKQSEDQLTSNIQDDDESSNHN